MKKLLVLGCVMILFSILSPSQDISAGVPDGPVSEWPLPEEICFPEVPGIDNCIDPGVAHWYLLDSMPITYANRVDNYVELSAAVWTWGYPLTDLHWERNADGDCRLTQWFERAVFEFQPAAHGIGWTTVPTFRRLGAELHGDSPYEPQSCTAGDWHNER